MQIKKKEIIVSGIRPTGNIHLGNYNGVIKNWINLQNKYTCFFFIADIHALTTNYENTENLSTNTKSMLIELLALGLDPKKCNIFIQSQIPEIFEMQIIISMFTKVARLERIPSYKDEKNNTNKTYGFLGYPILQAADVLSFNANYVPIGQDQLPHMELIKEISRKINATILKNKQFKLNDPNPILCENPKILGIDGQKMSKSQNNTILVSDTGKLLEKKINKFVTDPHRIYRTQSGTPEICPIWFLHKIYTEKKQTINESCKKAQIDCTQCKKILFENINKENIKHVKEIEKKKSEEKTIINSITKSIKNTRLAAKQTINQIKSFLNL